MNRGELEAQLNLICRAYCCGFLTVLVFGREEGSLSGRLQSTDRARPCLEDTPVPSTPEWA